MKNKALIIDDHQLFSAGISRLITTLADIKTVECFVAPTDIDIDKYKDVRLIVTDFFIPGSDTVEWIATYKKSMPRATIVVLSSSISPNDKEHAIAAGADAYFEKNLDPEYVLSSIQQMLSPSLALPITQSPSVDHTNAGGLSNRQITILIQQTRGYTYKEIAKQLSISPETVKSHTSSIYKKLNVVNKKEACEWARENGLL